MLSLKRINALQRGTAPRNWFNAKRSGGGFQKGYFLVNEPGEGMVVSVHRAYHSEGYAGQRVFPPTHTPRCVAAKWVIFSSFQEFTAHSRKETNTSVRLPHPPFPVRPSHTRIYFIIYIILRRVRQTPTPAAHPIQMCLWKRTGRQFVGKLSGRPRPSWKKQR